MGTNMPSGLVRVSQKHIYLIEHHKIGIKSILDTTWNGKELKKKGWRIPEFMQ